MALKIKWDLDSIAVDAKGSMGNEEVFNPGGITPGSILENSLILLVSGANAHGGTSVELQDSAGSTIKTAHGPTSTASVLKIIADAIEGDNGSTKGVVNWKVSDTNFSSGKVIYSIGGTATGTSKFNIRMGELVTGGFVRYISTVIGSGHIKITFPFQVVNE